MGATRLPPADRRHAARLPVGARGVDGRVVVVVGQGQHVDHDVAALHGLPARPALPAPTPDVARGRRAWRPRRSWCSCSRTWRPTSCPARTATRASARHAASGSRQQPAEEVRRDRRSTTSASARGTSRSPSSPCCCSRGLGVQSFVGTIYTWWAIRSHPGLGAERGLHRLRQRDERDRGAADRGARRGDGTVRPQAAVRSASARGRLARDGARRAWPPGC